MVFLLTSLHVLVCLFLIFVVLLQSAQAADLAGAFGGGGSQTALGMRGATTLLHKATTAAAVGFMLTSLALGMTGRSSSSLLEGLDDPAANAPAAETTPGGDTVPVPAADEEEAADESGTSEPDVQEDGAAQDEQAEGTDESGEQ